MALVFSLAFFFSLRVFTSIPVRRLIILQHGRQCRKKKNPHSSPLPKCGDDDRHKRYHFFTQRSMVRVSEKRVFMVYGRLDGPIRRGCVLDRKIRPVPEFRKIADSVPYGKGGGFMDAGPSRSRSSNRTRKTMDRFWGWLMLI